MTLEEFNENEKYHKHFKMTFENIDTYNMIKKLSHAYKFMSFKYYECFKRAVLLYYMIHRGDGPDFCKCLDYFFKLASGVGSMDIVYESVTKKSYITTYHFPIMLLNPNTTSRKKFEEELIKFLKKP